MRKRRVHSFEFEVERAGGTVEYVVHFTVDPGEKGTGPSYDCAGTPDIGPGVEDKEVFLVRVEPCPEHRFKFYGRESCRACRHVLEPRPELVDLVNDEELLEAAGESEMSAREAAAEARWEARHDR